MTFEHVQAFIDGINYRVLPAPFTRHHSGKRKMKNSPKITELLTGRVLDTKYTGQCSCFYSRNYGYMGTTAYADKQYHERKGHTFTITSFPAEPLTAKVCVQLMRLSRKNRTVTMSSDML